MKAQILRTSTLVIWVIIAFIQPGCENKSDTVYKVKLATSSTLGNYLVDQDGRTLYYFSNDANGRTSCFGGCASLWPYFSVTGLTQTDLGPGLDIADFDTINVNGIVHVRYKSWPLYYYAPVVGGVNVIEPAGQTTGEGLNNVWFVAKPDYSIMLVNAQLTGLNGKNYTGSYVEGVAKTLYFSDPKGATLYIFVRDSLNHNKYTKSDFSNNATWPMYETSETVVPSILDKSLFNHITVFGRIQLTYKGWPLYYFGQDNMIRGSNKGVSVPTPGIWPVGVKDLPVPPGK